MAEIHFLIFYDKINHRIVIDSTFMMQGPVDFLTSSTGQSVVLLHGLAASHHDWDWLKPELLQAGYRVISPDLPGHGVNPGPDDPDQFSIETIYAGLTNWVTRKRIEKPLILIGHSLGGYLSILLASQYTELISKLVLVAPFYSPNQLFFLARHALQYPGLSEQVLRLANVQVVYSILTLVEPIAGKYPSKARWQSALDYTRTKPASMRFPASAQDLSPFLQKISCPTLLVWGQQDFILNPKYYLKMVESMLDVQVYSFPNCGHEPHLTQSERFNKIVLEFLRE